METLTWEEFKKIFYDKYFTPDVQARPKREFRNLRQRDMSVAEYVKKFDRSCHFFPLIVDNPVEKLQYFLDSLSPAIRRDGKAKPFFSGKPQGQQAPKPAMQLEKPTCQTFGHQHVGKCLLGVGACYKCNQPGHLSFDCPQLRGPATRRVYMMKTEEADPYTTLITGRVLVLGVATKALFDSRATHSFISHAFVHRKGIAQVGLTESLLVTIPFGEELSTTSIIQNLKMVLQGHTMHADLIVFPMPEFSIILGMVIAHLPVLGPLQWEIQSLGDQTSDNQLKKWRLRDEDKSSGIYTVSDGIVKYKG
ncbi:hypothetical protein ZIOFF_056096 [Zingiber officinale]|uniref:CCHC-type domain-containing protein n=1 Tax=Zingiber officinale TaxID=94328 RepID=A0A8J5FFX3_ZINOF|nr:hypothetical protein ZIOFF_056096 [Zingiber officinale]